MPDVTGAEGPTNSSIFDDETAVDDRATDDRATDDRATDDESRRPADEEVGEEADPDAGARTATVTVALVHPDASRRSLLERKLQRSTGIRLILSASELDHAVDDVVDLLPDVVALAPTDALIEQVARLERDAPATFVLVLDPSPEDFAALAAGAHGTLPSGGSEITKAVTGIARDEAVLTPEWAGLLVEAIDAVDDRVKRLALLNETEREVLERLAQGETPREIADSHEVGERLVNLHVGYAVGKYRRAAEAIRALDAYEAVRDAPPPPGEGWDDGDDDGDAADDPGADDRAADGPVADAGDTLAED